MSIFISLSQLLIAYYQLKISEYQKNISEYQALISRLALIFQELSLYDSIHINIRCDCKSQHAANDLFLYWLLRHNENSSVIGKNSINCILEIKLTSDAKIPLEVTDAHMKVEYLVKEIADIDLSDIAIHYRDNRTIWKNRTTTYVVPTALLGHTINCKHFCIFDPEKNKESTLFCSVPELKNCFNKGFKFCSLSKKFLDSIYESMEEQTYSLTLNFEIQFPDEILSFPIYKDLAIACWNE